MGRKKQQKSGNPSYDLEMETNSCKESVFTSHQKFLACTTELVIPH